MGAIHTSRCDYALRAMLELARREGLGPVRVTEIAESQAAPARFLEAILGDLRKAGLIESRRGVKGGYWLGRRPADIRIGEIIREVDGPLQGVPADEAAGADPRRVGSLEPFASLWAEATGTLERFYEGVTLADLVERDARARSMRGPEFVI